MAGNLNAGRSYLITAVDHRRLERFFSFFQLDTYFELGIYQVTDEYSMPRGYSIELHGHYPACMQGDAEHYSNTGTMEQAETCAQFIRDRCNEIDFTSVEY